MSNYEYEQAAIEEIHPAVSRTLLDLLERVRELENKEKKDVVREEDEVPIQLTVIHPPPEPIGPGPYTLLDTQDLGLLLEAKLDKTHRILSSLISNYQKILADGKDLGNYDRVLDNLANSSRGVVDARQIRKTIEERQEDG